MALNGEAITENSNSHFILIQYRPSSWFLDSSRQRQIVYDVSSSLLARTREKSCIESHKFPFNYRLTRWLSSCGVIQFRCFLAALAGWGRRWDILHKFYLLRWNIFIYFFLSAAVVVDKIIQRIFPLVYSLICVISSLLNNFFACLL